MSRTQLWARLLRECRMGDGTAFEATVDAIDHWYYLPTVHTLEYFRDEYIRARRRDELDEVTIAFLHAFYSVLFKRVYTRGLEYLDIREVPASQFLLPPTLVHLIKTVNPF